MGDEGIGRIDYVGGRTVVQFQPECPGIGKIPLEIEYVLDLGSAEAVDRLRIVTNDTDVSAATGKLEYDLVLGHVGVLILIHHNMAEA